MKYFTFLALFWALNALAQDLTAGLPTSSSDFKILDDLKNRVITADEAWLYRVQARLDSKSLPEKYKATEAEGQDPMQNSLSLQFMNQVAQALPKMSAATQNAIIPFLMPPAARSTAKGIKVACPGYAPIPDPMPEGEWIYDDRDPTFRFWYVNYPKFGQKENDWVVSHLATALNKAKAKYEVLLGKNLLSDVGGSTFKGTDGKIHTWCDGGNAKYDIYLNALEGRDYGWTLAYPGKTSVTPSFIIIDPVKMYSFPARTEFTAAHELFHAFQFVHERNLPNSEYQNSDEGMANWAANFVFPNNQYEHNHDFWATHPSYSLLSRDYDTWMFFFYMTRLYGDSFVASVLQNEVNQNPYQAMDNVMPGGFKKIFPDFLLKAYFDEDIVGESFKTWDDWSSHPYYVFYQPVKADLDARGEYLYEKEFDLGMGLARGYEQFKLDKNVKSISISWGKAGIDESNFHFRFLAKKNGSWKTENWDPSERPTKYKFKDTICLDDPQAERFDEMLIAFARSDFKPKFAGYWDGSKIKIKIGMNNLPCYAVEGTGGITNTYKKGTQGTGNYTEQQYVSTFVSRFEAKRDADGRLTDKWELKSVTAKYTYSHKSEILDPCAQTKSILCKILTPVAPVETCIGNKSGTLTINNSNGNFSISSLYTTAANNYRAYQFKLPQTPPAQDQLTVDCPKSADFTMTISHPDFQSGGQAIPTVKPNGEIHDTWYQQGMGTAMWDFLPVK